MIIIPANPESAIMTGSSGNSHPVVIPADAGIQGRPGGGKEPSPSPFPWIPGQARNDGKTKHFCVSDC